MLLWPKFVDFMQTVAGREKIMNLEKSLDRLIQQNRKGDFSITFEMQYAEDLERFYSLCFAHPSVVGANRFGFWEPEMWPRAEKIQEACLWRSDWTVTPAGEIHRHLITDEWTTKGKGEINQQGELEFRGFYGTYQINLEQSSFSIDLTPNKLEATVNLPNTGKQ